MNGPSDETDSLKCAIAGDEVALTVLRSSTRRSLCDFVAKRLPPALRGQIDADDLAQDTQVEICRHIGSFDPQGTGPSSDGPG